MFKISVRDSGYCYVSRLVDSSSKIFIKYFWRRWFSVFIVNTPVQFLVRINWSQWRRSALLLHNRIRDVSTAVVIDQKKKKNAPTPANSYYCYLSDCVLDKHQNTQYVPNFSNEFCSFIRSSLLVLVCNSTFGSMSQEYKLNWSVLTFLINIKSIG